MNLSVQDWTATLSKYYKIVDAAAGTVEPFAKGAPKPILNLFRGAADPSSAAAVLAVDTDALNTQVVPSMPPEALYPRFQELMLVYGEPNVVGTKKAGPTKLANALLSTCTCQQHATVCIVREVGRGIALLIEASRIVCILCVHHCDQP